VAKGRRAAERRREREKAQGLDPDPTGAAKETTRVSVFDARADTALGTAIGPGAQQQPIDEDRVDDAGPGGERAEVTVVRTVERPPKKRGGRLKVRSGPDAGRDLLLTSTPTLVGRGADADVRLTDPAVSRAHLELRYDEEEERWVASDLGSTSGVLLCGAPLGPPMILKHGDLLQLGGTELRFLWATNEPTPKPEPDPEPEPKERTRTGFRLTGVFKEATVLTKTLQRPPRPRPVGQRRLMAVGLAAALLLVAGGGLAAWLLLRAPEDAGHKREQVQALLTDAERLFDEGRLDEARLRLDTALSLSPKEPVAESLLRMLESEGEAKAALDEARAFLAAGQVSEALRPLGRIADSSRLARARDEARAKADQSHKQASVRAVERRVDAGDYDGALALLAPHKERWPDDRFALALEERVHKLKGAPPPDPPAVARARDAFERGQLLDARLLVEPEATRRGAAERYLRDLERFEGALAAGTRLWRAKDRAAKDELETAFRLLPRLGRSDKGALRKELERPLADALYLDAMAARARGESCAWASGVQRAKALSPHDAKIAAQQRAADQEASAALTRAEARAASDKQGARAIAEAGLCFAVPGSTTHKGLRALAR
jgi:pSer/pThr/pTyr-binding forkhead associated (FHA) protein